MQDFAVVESLQPAYDLNEDVPDFLLFDVGFSFLIVAYFLEHVAVVRVLHDKAGRGEKVIVTLTRGNCSSRR